MPQKLFEMAKFDICYCLHGVVEENGKEASRIEMWVKRLILQLIGKEVLGVLYRAGAGRASN
jgi:hypothetical protein